MGKTSHREYAVLSVFAFTILGWMFLGRDFGLASIALASVVALFVFKLVRWKDVEEYVNWGILLMYGGAIILGSALERSGAALWFAKTIMGESVSGPAAAIAVFSFFSLLLTEGMSNAAVIAVLLPVGIGLSGAFLVDPSVVTYAIAVPAGLAFCLPMSTPANAIAVSSNFITVRDMAKWGVLMGAISWAAFNLTAWLYWPLIGLW
jgi:sodium-dependent dicarboxylate transporter 2/3/5